MKFFSHLLLVLIALLVISIDARLSNKKIQKKMQTCIKSKDYHFDEGPTHNMCKDYCDCDALRQCSFSGYCYDGGVTSTNPKAKAGVGGSSGFSGKF